MEAMLFNALASRRVTAACALPSQAPAARPQRHLVAFLEFLCRSQPERGGYAGATASNYCDPGPILGRGVRHGASYGQDLTLTGDLGHVLETVRLGEALRCSSSEKHVFAIRFRPLQVRRDAALQMTSFCRITCSWSRKMSITGRRHALVRFHRGLLFSAPDWPAFTSSSDPTRDARIRRKERRYADRAGSA